MHSIISECPFLEHLIIGDIKVPPITSNPPHTPPKFWNLRSSIESKERPFQSLSQVRLTLKTKSKTKYIVHSATFQPTIMWPLAEANLPASKKGPCISHLHKCIHWENYRGTLTAGWVWWPIMTWVIVPCTFPHFETEIIKPQG